MRLTIVSQPSTPYSSQWPTRKPPYHSTSYVAFAKRSILITQSKRSSCQGALSGFHQATHFFFQRWYSHKHSHFPQVSYCQSLRLARLPAFCLSRPFRFSTHPRILIAFFHIFGFFDFFFQTSNAESVQK